MHSTIEGEHHLWAPWCKWANAIRQDCKDGAMMCSECGRQARRVGCRAASMTHNNLSTTALPTFPPWPFAPQIMPW